MLVGTLQIQMMADMARLQADMNKANSIVSDGMKSITQMVELAQKALVGLAGVTSANAFMDMVRGNVAAVNSLGKLATQAGVTVEALSGLAGVGKLSGTSADTVAGAMNRMTKAMTGADEEGRGAAAAIRALGLNFNDFQRLSPDERMVTVAKAMDQFQDGAGKSGVAMALMGKAGAEMLPYMKDLAVAGELHAKVTAGQVAMAKDFENNLKKVTATSEAWKKELSMGLLPALDDASKAYIAVMNGAGGFRDEITKLSQDGTIAEWTKGAVIAVSYLVDALEGALRVAKAIGIGMGAQWAAMAASAQGDFAGAKTIIKEAWGDIEKVFSAQSLGSKFREQLELAEQAKVKHLQDYQEKVRQVIEAYAGYDIQVQRAAQKSLAESFFGVDKPQVNLVNPVGAGAIDGNLATYQSLIKAIQEKTAADLLDMQTQGSLSEGQKEALKIMEDLRTGVLKLSDARKAELTRLLEVRLATEQQRREQDAAEKQLISEMQARQALRIKEYNGINEYFLKQTEGFNAAEKGAQDALKAEQARYDQFGLTRSQIEELVVAELKLKQSRINVDNDERQSLQRQIDTREKLVALMKSSDDRAAEIASYKSMWESVDRTAHDTFVNIFEGGQDAFTKLTNVLKSTLLDLLYQMTVKKWVFEIFANVTGAGSAVGGAAGVAGTVGTASNSISLISAGSSVYRLGSQVVGGGMSVGNAMGTMWGNASGTGIDGLLSTNGAYGTAAGSGGAAAGSSAGFAGIPVVGWIAMGMIASGNAYDQGFRAGNRGGIGYTVSDGGQLGPNGMLQGLDKMLQGLGIDGKTAAILTGSALGSQAMYSLMGGYHVSSDGSALVGSVSASGNSQLQNRYDFTQDHRGPLGIGSYTTHNSEYAAADQSAIDYVNAATKIVGASVKQLASSLGLSADAIDGFTSQIDVSLTGLNSDQQKAAVDSAITGFMDQMITSVYGSEISALAHSGETSSTTLARLAIDISTVNGYLRDLGFAILPLGIDSAAVAAGLVDAAGGLDKLQSSVDFYFTHFYSTAEQSAAATAHLNDQFTALGLTMPTTRQGFRDLVNSINITTPAGQALEVSLLNLAPAFDAVASAAEQANQRFQQSYAAALKDYGTPQQQRDYTISQIQAGLAAGGINLTADQIGSANRNDAVSLFNAYAGNQKAQQAILDQASAFASLTPAMNDATNAMIGGGSSGGSSASGGVVGAADTLANAFQSLTDSIFKEVYRIRGLEAGPGQAGLAYAQSRFTLATAQARAGDQSAAAALPGLSQSLEQLQKDNARTLQELNLMRGRTASSLETTGNILASQYGLKIPSFDVGTNLIPHDMFAMLHAGEAVIPAAYNPANGGGGVTGNTARLEELVEALTEKVSRLEESSKATANSTDKIKKVLVNVTHDGAGMLINEDSLNGGVVISAS